MSPRLFFLFLLSSAPLLGAEPAPLRSPVTAPVVLVARYSGVINPPSAEFLQAAVETAAARKREAVVIELDTPGGLDLSMREIVKTILASPIPVLVYVSPAGGRAASAGVFITMAAHVAAMAPGTNIGAAHPVSLGMSPKEKEKADPVMEAKMENDMGAYLQAIAARRGRNANWAKEVVVKSVSIVSAEAVSLRVVDLEAESLEALLKAVDGRGISDFPGRPLRTAGAAIERFEMTRRQKLLAAVSDPNIAMILMTLGVSGLLIELYSPGLILPGVVGAVSLVLAFYSFQTLSAAFAGLMLILIGFILFILELKVTSFGLLGLSGAAAVLFGGMMLFRDNAGGLHVSSGVLFGTLGAILAVMTGLMILVKSVLSRRSMVGACGLAGSACIAASALEPRGMVLLGGELWRAESLDGLHPAGSELVVQDAQGLTLRVKARKAS